MDFTHAPVLCTDRKNRLTETETVVNFRYMHVCSCVCVCGYICFNQALLSWTGCDTR